MERRILLVVRGRAMREYLAQAFCRRGFCVATASDGVAGLFQLGLCQPHLVVLDIPDREVLQRIRRLSDIPVIALVEDTPEARLASLDQGADFFVVKPLNLSELDARVRVLLRRGLTAGSGEAALQARTQDLADSRAPQRV